MEKYYFAKFFICCLLGISSVPNTAADAIDDCVQYIPGNFNLILTAPHGGDVAVPSCPSRRGGCIVNGKCFYDSSSSCTVDDKCDYSYLKDSFTAEIATMMKDNIAALMNMKPHLVIMKCTRQTVDVNREVNEAAQGCSNAIKVFNNYHNKIQAVINGFNGKRGLLLDIHGQAHKQNSTELGYGIDKSTFDLVASSTNHEFPSNSLKSATITALLSRLTSGGKFTNYDVIMGSQSMGQLLQNEGLAALPGPKYPVAGNTAYQYFNGGYTVQTYGSHSASDLVDAIQMEGPGELRVDGGNSTRVAFAMGLARAAVNFFKRNYL